MAVQVVLPGEEIPESLLPTSKNPEKPLRLGPGLRHTPPSTITSTVAGTLNVDNRKNGIWVEYNSGRYIPHTNDLVIAQVHHSSTDSYHCALSPHTPFATLPHLAFENATKKTRPILASGAIVYARVAAASKHMDPELECLSATTGKADGLGPLKGGMVFDVSAGMARRLLMPAGKKDGEEGGPGRVVVLEALAERVRFEVAVGRNGRVWVDSDEGVKVILAVGRALQEADREGLGVDGQHEVVAKVLKTL
ncbi:hypothetical protein HDK77DRAFT_380652 [Phyllosticta capitalensis]|uniref:Ribosomal RNA-processing protein 40 n=1 Tax=Phyllosticta capitalensis TaxID=121624 RepID=A0ABR1YIC0_9PEZI